MGGLEWPSVWPWYTGLYGPGIPPPPPVRAVWSLQNGAEPLNDIRVHSQYDPKPLRVGHRRGYFLLQIEEVIRLASGLRTMEATSPSNFRLPRLNCGVVLEYRSRMRSCMATTACHSPSSGA